MVHKLSPSYLQKRVYGSMPLNSGLGLNLPQFAQFKSEGVIYI